MLGGRELNIYHLYQEVQKRGGSEKVPKSLLLLLLFTALFVSLFVCLFVCLSVR